MENTREQGATATLITLPAGLERMQTESLDTRLARLERLAQRLFGLASCFIRIGSLRGRFDFVLRDLTAIEAQFVEELPTPATLEIIEDLAAHPRFKAHRMIAMAPSLRFLAGIPVLDAQDQPCGALFLLDYQPRKLDDNERWLLSDMADLVQKELIAIAAHQLHSDMLRQNRALRREALLDPLLGTWSRNSIFRALEMEKERCEKSAKPLSLLLLTLDQFGELGERFGTRARDTFFLKAVSRIRSCVRPFDALGRYSDDSVMVVLPGAAHIIALAVAERIRVAIRMHPEMHDEIPLSLSVTLASISTDVFPSLAPDALVGMLEHTFKLARAAGTNHVLCAQQTTPDLPL